MSTLTHNVASFSLEDQQITKELTPLPVRKLGRITNPAEEAAFWHNLLIASFNGKTEAQFTIFGSPEAPVEI